MSQWAGGLPAAATAKKLGSSPSPAKRGKAPQQSESHSHPAQPYCCARVRWSQRFSLFAGENQSPAAHPIRVWRSSLLCAGRIDDLASCLYQAAVNLVAMQRQITLNDFRTDLDF